MLKANDPRTLMLAVYIGGVIFTMISIVIYLYIRTKTKKIVLLFWAGFGFGLLWPILLSPFFWICLYCAKSFYINEQFDNSLGDESDESDESTERKPQYNALPKVVTKLDPKLISDSDTNKSCAICCEKISIKSEHLRSSREPEVLHSHKHLRDLDTCVTVCGHVFHYHCLDCWFKNHLTCPTCRQEQTMDQCYVIHRSGKHRTHDIGSVYGSTIKGDNTTSESVNDVIIDVNTLQRNYTSVGPVIHAATDMTLNVTDMQENSRPTINSNAHHSRSRNQRRSFMQNHPQSGKRENNMEMNINNGYDRFCELYSPNVYALPRVRSSSGFVPATPGHASRLSDTVVMPSHGQQMKRKISVDDKMYRYHGKY